MTHTGATSDHPEGVIPVQAGDALAEVERRISTELEPDDAERALRIVREVRAAATETPPASVAEEHAAGCDCGSIDGGHPGDCGMFRPPAAPDTGGDEHIRNTMTDNGPGWCLGCSEAAQDYVEWPCSRARLVEAVRSNEALYRSYETAGDTGDSEITVEWGIIREPGDGTVTGEPEWHSDAWMRAHGSRYRRHVRRERTRAPDRVTDWQEVPARPPLAQRLRHLLGGRRMTAPPTGDSDREALTGHPFDQEVAVVVAALLAGRIDGRQAVTCITALAPAHSDDLAMLRKPAPDTGWPATGDTLTDTLALVCPDLTHTIAEGHDRCEAIAERILADRRTGEADLRARITRWIDTPMTDRQLRSRVVQMVQAWERNALATDPAPCPRCATPAGNGACGCGG